MNFYNFSHALYFCVLQHGSMLKSHIYNWLMLQIVQTHPLRSLNPQNMNGDGSYVATLLYTTCYLRTKTSLHGFLLHASRFADHTWIKIRAMFHWGLCRRQKFCSLTMVQLSLYCWQSTICFFTEPCINIRPLHPHPLSNEQRIAHFYWPYKYWLYFCFHEASI